MIIKYNIDKIREFIRHFYNVSKLPTSLWDQDMNQMTFQPENMIDFCALIKSSPIGNKRCLLCDQEICGKAKASKKPESHLCHAGLWDTAIPLVNDDTVYGYFMFGQGKGPDRPLADRALFEQLGTDLQLPPDRLYETYLSLPTLDTTVIDSSLYILETAIPYLFSSSYINYTDNELICMIDAYINENITEKLTASDICDEFRISKTRLYSLSESWHGKSLGKYILDKRMKKARKLLTNTDDAVSKICIDVGIPDYNYFSKVFKRYYGVPPKQYRKQFPLILGTRNGR